LRHIHIARLAALLFFLATIVASITRAQSSETKPQTAKLRVDPNGSVPTTAPAGTPAPTKRNVLLRHIQFVTVDSIAHYRYVDSAEGKVGTRDLFYKLSTRVQVNLWGDGKTYLQARGESGRSLAASYDYTGAGLHEAYWSFNLKSLFVGQKLGKHLEAQVGGVEFDQGAGTEATYADNDAWLEGYRLRYTGLGHKGLPDKVSVTVGYIGDFLQPNVFARFPRMGDENYIQVMASRKLGTGRELSAEFDSIQRIRYTREAFRWQKLPVPVVQDLSLETMIRASDNPTFGWSGSLFRSLERKGRARLGAFYSDMPMGIFLKGQQQVLLNGDSYVLGKRIGPVAKVTPFKDFEISLFGSKRLDNTPGTRYRGQIAVRYQLASLFNRALK